MAYWSPAREGRTLLDVYVIGQPTTKGSLRATRTRRGKWRQVEQTQDRLSAWTACLRAAVPTPLRPCSGPVQLIVRFYFPRPAKHYDRAGTLRDSAPVHFYGGRRLDVDKLERALLDALTGYVWTDDSNVVEVIKGKAYADKMHPVGASVEVYAL